MSVDPVTAQAVEVALGLSDEQRQATRFWLAVLGVLGTGSLVGVAFSLYLVNHYPLLLIALSPLGRHLVLVAPIVDPIAFMVVSVSRRMLFYLASFHLGRALGPVGIPWIEARAARFGQFVRFVERLFERAPHLVVLVLTGPTVAALAGISRMRLAAFVPLAAVSLTVRMLVTIYFAEWMREYIEIALVWIDEYWVPGTVLMVAGVAAYRWRRRTPLRVMED
jgi:hypothetical protein